MARNRARARVNWVSQGQRWGRCRVKRRAERVSRPAIEENCRRRVLVVTTCSPRLMRAAQRAGLCAITCTASPDPYQVDADARAPTSVAEAHRFAGVVRTGPRSMNFSIPIWITASE